MVATDGQGIGRQLQNRIVQLETELAELKGNLVHGSANAGRLIGGLLAADGRLEKSVAELRSLMDWAMDMGDESVGLPHPGRWGRESGQGAPDPAPRVCTLRGQAPKT